ncbi:DUF4365 domain-containing protein [Actinospica sp. MGRD01-02]|uniref:DUF4365 domain-containing protein n=1 Tax=Actinospica acidithermotolerans TaxID=2828514 RepID=A0A941IH02_9ACTN|nr:DUF4365 domain-containing protein [Actinospica acidithermotolerans]MBR7824683.1 DUF4365 domain-containing protein [Actinospica acidithermotolerans]
MDGQSWQKEQISKAFVLAIASQAGVTIGEWNVDKDGVDVTLRKRQLMVDFQLKCTRSARSVGGDYVFDLDLPTYEKLVDPDRSAPAYLCLVIVPRDLEDWLTHHLEAVELKCHGYWTLMEPGQPPPGRSSTAVRLPRLNRLDGTSLERMFEESRRMRLLERITEGGRP